MIQKVISGGQTGADRGGLDAAIELDIEHGGWCPKYRKSEAGTIPTKYNLQETESSSYKERTEFNIVDSDATVIIADTSKGKMSSGSELTEELCYKLNKSVLIISYWGSSNPETAIYMFEDQVKIVVGWLKYTGIKVLNVAGNRESVSPGIQKFTKELLVGVINVLHADKESI